MGQVLHDYQDELGGTGSLYDDVKNFISVGTEYGLTQRIVLGAGVRYVMDEQESDQATVALNAAYRY
jgi:outer membrane receptor for monomeric catechols